MSIVFESLESMERETLDTHLNSMHGVKRQLLDKRFTLRRDVLFEYGRGRENRPVNLATSSLPERKGLSKIDVNVSEILFQYIASLQQPGSRLFGFREASR